METELKIIHVLGILQSPIICLGLFGNFLSFLVFSRKAFAKYSISVYFRAMAISECFAIYKVAYDILFYFYNIKLGTVSNFWCKVHYYVLIGMFPISIWILVAFSIDKMIHVLGKKQSFPFIEKRSFQLAVVLGIAIFHCLIYSCIPILIQLKKVVVANETHLSCLIENMPNCRYLSAFILLEATVVPFCLMTMTSIVIIIKLNQSRNKLKKCQGNALRERKLKDVKFAVSSIVLNLLDVIFEVPLSLVFLMKFQNPIRFRLLLAISLFLFHMSYSISFLIHFTFNRLFRNEFLLMLRIKKQQQITSILQSSRKSAS
jgi:hypothetical protein